MSSTNCSKVIRLTDGFSKALAILAASLRRSKGSCVRSRLTTRKSERSISSYVVKRYPQLRHSRRRRMLELSRDWRESMTLSSRDPHLGQRMVGQSNYHTTCCGVNTKICPPPGRVAWPDEGDCLTRPLPEPG